MLTFDNGLEVKMGKQIAEGGFSYVYEAFPTDTADTTATANNKNSDHGKYALKRMNCSDDDILRACRHEAGVHRLLPGHPNLLELLGLKFDTDMASSGSGASSSRAAAAAGEQYTVCYMLFPYIPNSLRGEITSRNILSLDNANGNHPAATAYRTAVRRRPFSLREIAHLFGGIVDALMAMHNANLSHRDIKLENILLQPTNSSYSDGIRGGGGSNTNTRSSNSRMPTPILMDFGSAGPLSTTFTTRQQVLTLVENAASNTTMPYRPPELFEGGVRHRNGGGREVLDYGRVDVWSLGCVLFGLMHGTSPFEMEFLRNNGEPQQQHGLVRIVECTHLKILGEVPFPSVSSPRRNNVIGSLGGTAISKGNTDGTNGKYPPSLYQFIQYMLNHDRASRPNIQEVAKRFGALHLELVGERWISYEDNGSTHYGRGDSGADVGKGEGQQYDDFDSFIASRDFV